MPKETFNSPVLQAAHDNNGGWRGESHHDGGEYIFIEDSFSE